MKQIINLFKNIILKKKAILITAFFVLSFLLLLPQPSQAVSLIYLYQHTGYGGQWATFAENHPNFNNLPGPGPPPTWNDEASSIKVPSGARATLYQHTGYGGVSRVFTADHSDFTAISGPSGQGNWNDQASSIKICEDHCSPFGKKQCQGTQYVQCGNHDSDPCTEWSYPQSCPSGQTCEGAGVCSAPPLLPPSTSPANFRVLDENDQLLPSCYNTNTYIVHFKWGSASGATGYKFRLTGTDGYDTGVKDLGNNFGIGYGNRKVDVTYTAKVRGYNNAGNGPEASLSFNVSGCAPPPVCDNDGICEPAKGENSTNCPNDCPPAPANQTPNIPSTPEGPTPVTFNTLHTYSTSATDPDGDNIKYIFDWGDGSQTATEVWYASGESGEDYHLWYGVGNFVVRAKACDPHVCSNWGSGLIVNVWIPEQPIPCGEPADENYQVCYYEGTDANINKFISNSNAIESGPKIDHNWGTGAIGGTTRADDISATWRGYFNFEQGKYNIGCFADNGIIIKVDGNEVYREFADDGSVYAIWCDNAPTLDLSGRTKIEVIWNEKDGNARLAVDFEKVEEPEPVDDCNIGYGYTGVMTMEDRNVVWNQLVNLVGEDVASIFFLEVIPCESSWIPAIEAQATNCYGVGLYQLEDNTRGKQLCSEYHRNHHWTCQTPHAMDVYLNRGTAYWQCWP